MTFCLFVKHLYMSIFYSVYIYECIKINSVFEKRNNDNTFYTSKEIDWFGSKDNIKI